MKKNKKANDLSALGGLVFSTNNDWQEQEEDTQKGAKDLTGAKLILRYETAHRGGKKVTIVTRFEGNEEQLKDLAKALKQHCGTGGSIVDDEIVIQGDNRQKIKTYLRSKGYKTNDI